MDENELLLLVAELLEKHFENEEPRKTFVAVQDEDVIVMQAGSPHYGITIVPAQVSVPA